MARKRNIASALAGDDDDTPVVPKAKKVAAKALPSDQVPGTVDIVLEENDNIPPTGQFFGVNGRSYLLRAGEAANVPREILNVLNDAVMDVPQIDPTTRQVVAYRKRLRFPYRVLELAPA